MLVFSKEKLVFLSVPKTGTTAYEAALGGQAALVVREPPELKHSPVYRYNRFFRPALEKFCGEGFDLLAVMREPVDWLGSWYRYRQRDELKGTRTSTADVNFDEFVLGYMKGDRPAYAQVGSQAKFLEPQKNGTAVTHLFRYEDQSGLLQFLQTRLGREIVLGQRNRSPQSQTKLSEEVKARFHRKFAAEFQLYEGIRVDGEYTPLPHGVAPPHH